MSPRSQPPFRADQVGSLLRPKELLKARQRFADVALSRAGLRAVEDKCIAEAVAMQEGLGLKAVTDGEFRRTYWHVDFLVQIEGIREQREPGEQPRFKVSGWRPPVLEVAGKVRHVKPILGPGFDFLKSAAATAMPKVCLPAPGVVHFRGGRAAVDRKAYPEMDEFWSDLSAAYRAEVADLARRGCRYLQFDEVFFAYLCDSRLREQVRARGEDPDELARTYAKAINDSIRDRPAGMTVTMHVCRGNFKGTWVAEGGYGAVAEAMFSTRVDGFFLEYDDARPRDLEAAGAREQGRIETPHRSGREIRAARVPGAQPAMRLLEHGRGQPADAGAAEREAAPLRRGRERGLGRRLSRRASATHRPAPAQRPCTRARQDRPRRSPRNARRP